MGNVEASGCAAELIRAMVKSGELSGKKGQERKERTKKTESSRRKMGGKKTRR